MVRTGKLPNNYEFLSQEEKFEKFIQFLKKEYKIDLGFSNRFWDEELSQFDNVGSFADQSLLDNRSSYIDMSRFQLKPPAPARVTQENMIGDLDQSMNATSHLRFHTVLNQYQQNYRIHQNPEPVLAAPSDETQKARLFIWNRFSPKFR